MRVAHRDAPEGTGAVRRPLGVRLVEGRMSYGAVFIEVLWFLEPDPFAVGAEDQDNVSNG